MFNTLAAKALLGAGALAVAGGTTALAANPAVVAPAPSASTGASQAHQAADVRHGVIISVSGTKMTIERDVRDKTTKATTKDDTTFEITDATKVYRAGSKDPVGHDALKLGERVRVRFEERNGQKFAKRVVILHDVRAGKVVSKGDHSFVIQTKEHGKVTVTVNDKTKFTTGHRKDGKDGSLAALKVGDRAIALGEEDAQHNFDAAAVRYNDPPAVKTTTHKAQ